MSKAILIRTDREGVTAAAYDYPREEEEMFRDMRAHVNTIGVTSVEIIVPDEWMRT